jgi:hypothetical protein
MAGPALALVDRSGVAPVRLAEGKPQAGGVGGHEQEVDVVEHQAQTATSWRRHQVARSSRYSA